MAYQGYSVVAARSALSAAAGARLAAVAFAIAAATAGSPVSLAGERRPPDIVDARTVIPDLVVDMRYLTARNFVGRPIAGTARPCAC